MYKGNPFFNFGHFMSFIPVKWSSPFYPPSPIYDDITIYDDVKCFVMIVFGIEDISNKMLYWLQLTILLT